MQIFAQLFAKKIGPTNLCANICANFWKKIFVQLFAEKFAKKLAQIFYGSYLPAAGERPWPNFEFELERCQFCTVTQSRMENPVYCKIFRLNYSRIKHYTEHTDSRKSLFSVKIKR